ncbi:SDR family oxidoreductase [Candidatus Woesearchaeota archaeon]|nr:SDR family oxidoreductase [Candidatus Woesearchaeota archaeon]
MKILVIGGNRFIGLHLVNALLAKKFHVTVVNRGSRKGMYHGAAEELACDRDDTKAFSRLFAESHFDAVFDNCAYQPQQVEASLNLFKGKVKQYILISSVAVYDQKAKLPYGEGSSRGGHNLFSEYARGKSGCEDVLFEAENFPYTIIRPTYVYGPDDYSGRMDKLFKAVKSGSVIRIPKSNPRSQFVHVDDLATALMACIGNRKAIGQAFNICGDEIISYGELVELIGELTGKQPKVSFSILHDFPFMDWNMYCDASKSKSILGVKYRPLAQGLKETMET